MVKRYYIRKGDSTTAGGTVTEGSAVMHCDGLPLAFEGDAVSCPACHSTGKILCDGPRWPKAGPDGRQTALSDDLCLCRCNPLPRLIASQSTMSMSMDGSPADPVVQRATAHVYAPNPEASTPTPSAISGSAGSGLKQSPPLAFASNAANSGDVMELAARGVSEDDEAECHAQYELDMETCNAARAMYKNPAYFLACSQRAFERYQQCRGY
ncbi:PAAR domain-containing protein [Paraburkholderia caledonica]|jgi:uncharacterized Zn-binding protein involved in type VI secretion|uniref:PAAR domain-containing protein n=1 Tax=Paraburkholderia caledonica TaxID=134536 RepID=UPI000A07ADEB